MDIWVTFFNYILTQRFSLSIFDPKLSKNNPAFLESKNEFQQLLHRNLLKKPRKTPFLTTQNLHMVCVITHE